MKKFTIVLVFIFCYKNIFAQNIIDKMSMICKYKYTYTKHTINNALLKTDTMNLEIGNKVCKFYSYKNYLVDSIRNIKDQSEWFLYKKTDNGYTIYINYPEGKITTIDNITADINTYKYVENITKPDWIITNETKDIMSYKCKMATCRFKGRHYIAWYAADIPISVGPYKFTGLPGLILQIEDAEDKFVFECISIEKYNKKPIQMSKLNSVKTVTKKQFMHMDKQFCANPVASGKEFFKSMGMNPNDILQILGEFSKKTIPYDPIELEE